MSAIYGIVRFDDQPASPREIDRMGAMLAHRAPDGRDVLVDGAIGVGHGLTRVNVEDFHERQPLVDRERGLVLVADIRLDNREEIAGLTGLAAALLPETPDSALLLAAWRLWGEACVDHLVGDFAFALWDRQARRLTLGRDHMGQRGLFYHHGPDFIAFASEPRALWAVDGVPRRLSEQHIGRSLLHPIDPCDGATLYEGIAQLPGATVVHIGAGGTRTLRTYWEPHAASRHVGRDDAYYVDAYRRVLGEAVACRVRRLTKAPGLLFSGGFDSGSIAAIAAPIVAEQGRRIIAVSSVLGEDKPAGQRDARAACEAFRDWPTLDLRYYVRDKESIFTDIESSFDRGVGWGGTPYVRKALYTMVAEAGARLVLDGMGGDYTLHVRAPAMLGRILRRGHGRRYLRELVLRRRATGRSWRELLLYDTLPALLPLRVLATITFARRGFRPIWKTRAIRDDFARRLFDGGDIDPARLREPALVHNRWRDRWLHLLRKALAGPPVQTTLAAVHGLAFTRPFHDKRVVELALAIPERLHLRDGQERYLARMALGERLPKRLLDRPPGNDPEAPDLFRMARDSAPEALAQARAQDRDGRVSRYVDLDRIERMIENPSDKRPRDVLRLDVATRALAVARFVAWFDCRNER